MFKIWLMQLLDDIFRSATVVEVLIRQLVSWQLVLFLLAPQSLAIFLAVRQPLSGVLREQHAKLHRIAGGHQKGWLRAVAPYQRKWWPVHPNKRL